MKKIVLKFVHVLKKVYLCTLLKVYANELVNNL